MTVLVVTLITLTGLVAAWLLSNLICKRRNNSEN